MVDKSFKSLIVFVALLVGCKAISITLPESFSFNIGEERDFVVVVSPESDYSLQYDSNIVTIENNKIKALAEGETTVVATSQDGTATAECKVTVVGVKKVNATEISLSTSAITFKDASEESITVTVLPADATDKSWTYSVSKEEIVEITSAENTITIKPIEPIKFGEEVDITIALTENPEVKSICKIFLSETSYDVTFNANGGEGVITKISLPKDASGKLPLNTFTKENYRFKFWSLTADGVKAYDDGADIIMGSENIELFAIWEEQIWTLSYNNNGGTGEITSSTYLNNTEVTLPINTAIQKEGSYFRGWATEATGAKVYDDGASITITKDIQLFAVWELNVAPSVSANISKTINENTTLYISKTDLLANASDANGDTLSIVNFPATSGNATIVENETSFVISFTPNYAGAISIPYGVSDGLLVTNTALDITIEAVANTANLVTKIDNILVVEETQIIKTPYSFASATSGVNFDITVHTLQNVGGGIEKSAWDISEVTAGSNYGDTFLFSNIAAGETYTINGGNGEDVVNLANFSSKYVKMSTDNTGFQNGVTTVLIDLAGASSSAAVADWSGSVATIICRKIEKFSFNKNVFDGHPHSYQPKLDDALWVVEGGTKVYSPLTNEQNDHFSVLLLDYAGTLASNYELSADVTTTMPSGGGNKNAAIIFDYQDPNNYKAIVARVGMSKWQIENYVNGTNSYLASTEATISTGVTYSIKLKVEGRVAKFFIVEGGVEVEKVSYTFTDDLNDGRFGVGDSWAISTIDLKMKPSNWAPAVLDYNKVLEIREERVTLDLVGDSNDFEGSPMTLTSVTNPAHGQVINNGDGTITFVADPDFPTLCSFSYTISDGVNSSVGKVNIDVQDNLTVVIKPTDKYKIEILTSLVDTDGSETLQVLLKNLPLNCGVTDGTNNWSAPTANATLDITNWAYANLVLQNPSTQTTNYTISVDAISTENSNASSATATKVMYVHVDN